MKNQIFISYSHKDKEWLEKFQTMLSPLTRDKSVLSWDDTRIKPGSKWRDEIERNLNSAGVALLLVSANFLASEFISNNELPILLEAAEKKGLRVIWVSVSASMYKKTSISRYQAANDPATPLNSLSPSQLDQELVKICTLITEELNPPAPIAQVSVITSTFNDKISLAKPNKSGATTITNTDVTPNARPMQIAILYKRTVMPDELVLYFLETELKKNGHVVFIDRHLSIGTKWAEEIERQLRLADVVIPLLSAASIVSEMLTFELETAQDSAQKIGKPRILPVRVNFQGEIGGSLGSIINPLQYALWNNSRDNETLISQINSSINAQTYLQGHRPEPPGGVVPIESRFYIERSVDIELSEAIANQDSIILLKGARQTGKTSLLARGLKKAKDQGLKIIVTDFQKLNANSLKTIEAFYQGLGEIIANQLGLHIYPIDMWNPASAPNVNFENYIKNEVLENTSQQVVWAMDEVDRLFTTDFGSEVFGLFRSWFNERAYLSTPLEKMSLVIVYALEAHLFITDPYQSPFNVGTKLAVYDFYKSQVEELNIYHGKCLSTPEEFEEFYKLVGGHPYLVRRGLYEIFTKRSSFDEFINKADRDEGAYGDHLRRILIMIAKNTELWISIMEISQNRRCSSSEDFYRLRTAGIVNGNSQEDVDFRCQIYKNYLKRHNPNT